MTDIVISDETIEQARLLGTATLHEAGGKVGALPSRITPLDETLRLAGRAYTVDCPPADNLWIHHAIAEAAPGDVLVVTTHGERENGYIGEIMAVAAQARGLAGIVIDAGIRDAREIKELGFPVYNERRCIQGTRKDPSQSGSLQRSITIGAIIVRPGDLVVGDADGVVVIPAARADEVVAQGRARVEDEASIMDELRAGATTLAVYDLPDIPR